MKIYYEWICLLSTDKAASLTASENVGWAWQVLAISSELAPNSIAIAISAISSPAWGPIKWTPNTLSVVESAKIFTNPSVSLLTFARQLL